MPVICLKHVREDQRLGVLMEVEDEKAQFLSGFRDRMASTKFRALARTYEIVEYSEDYKGLSEGIKLRYERFIEDGATFKVDLIDLSRDKSPPSPPPPPPNTPTGDVLDLTDAIARSAAKHKQYVRSLNKPKSPSPSPPPPPPNTPEKSK